MQNNDLVLLQAGTSSILPKDSLDEKLKTGKKLKIKLGMDPTSPDLHLGHAVVLEKMRQFQDLGHEIILIIGDYTAQIGDPTGKSKTRPSLTPEEIAANATTYFEQVGRILDVKKLIIRYNSEWLAPLTSADLIRLFSHVTLARLIEREDFANRIENNMPIRFHELTYPIFQGYDSIAIHADVELGGTDQTFNLLMGRFLQEQLGQNPQTVLTMPLLEGLDGHEKMSKSLNNSIGLTDPADQAYGKLMSISDALMWRYYLLLLNKSEPEIEQFKADVASGTLHPMACKKNMAYEIVKKFWSEKEAQVAQTAFEQLFQKKDYSQATPVALAADLANPIWIVDLLKVLGAIESTSQAKRLIEAGAVALDQVVVTDFKAMVHYTSGMTVKVGKHKFYKITM